MVRSHYLLHPSSVLRTELLTATEHLAQWILNAQRMSATVSAEVGEQVSD